jgi:3-hydroxybutyryl-CoA dehydrogenase
VQQVVDLDEPRVDADEHGARLREQVLAEAAAAVELDEQAAEIAKLLLADPEERPLLAPQLARVRPARRDAFRTRAALARSPPPERPHAGSVGPLPAPRLPRVSGIRTVGVVGLGTMGAGIAQLALEASLDTIALELDGERAVEARGRIAHFLGRKVDKGELGAAARDRALDRLRLVDDVAALGPCDLVVEAVFEELEAKRRVFAALERACRDDTILATNTSALSVGAIAAGLAHPERVVGMHFFNPAPLMPLVEIVRAERSSDAAVEAAYELATTLGRRPIRCADTPGFVVNRVLIPLLNDCVRVLDEARVSAEDLDTAMTLGAGWPLGPCALLDLIGIDVHVHASETLHAALGEERMAPPRRLRELLAEGKLGRKSGEGFSAYRER